MRSCLKIVLLLALPLVGCGDSPIDPTRELTSNRNPTSPMTERWALTSTLVAVEGPDNCARSGDRERIGNQYTWELAIKRTDGTIWLLYGVELDDTELTGELAGERFTARSAPSTFKAPGCVRTDSSHLTGRFSADFRQLTGQQEWIYVVEDQKFKLTYEWKAERIS